MAVKKLLLRAALPVLLVLVCLLPVIGCDQPGAAPDGKAPDSDTPTQEELLQVLVDAVLAAKDADSYEINMDMTMAMEIVGGAESRMMDMAMTAEGVVDQANNEMQMAIDMSMNTDIGGADEEMQDISMELYLLGDWLYMKMDLPQVGEQWMKMAASPGLMDQYSLNLASEQIEMMEAPGEVEFLRYETVNGSECYVLKIVPDMAKLIEWVSQQQAVGSGIDPANLEQLSDMFREVVYTSWIERDSKLVKRISADMIMDTDAEQVGEAGADFEKMTMDISVDMTMFDYNQAVDIVLPEAAQDAMEIPQ